MKSSTAVIKNFRYLKELGVKIPIRHCSNSAGIVESLESNHMDMVRAGIAIYGMYPSDEVDHNSVKLTPAMEIKKLHYLHQGD